MKPLKQLALTTLKVAVTMGLTVFILMRIDYRSIVPILSNGNYWLMAPTLGVWYATVLCGALRWRTLLAHYGIRIWRRESFSLYWIGTFFNNFLPSSMGGDSYKFLYLKRRHANIAWQEILSSIILDRGVGLLSMLLMSSILAPFYLPAFPLPPSLRMFLTGIGLLLALIPLAALASPRVLFLLPEPRNRCIASLVRLGNTLTSYADPRNLAVTLTYSGLFLLLQSAYYWICFFTFGYHVAFPVLLFVVPLISIAEIFPLALNSIGIREGVGVLLFGYFGISPAVSLSALFVLRLAGTFGGASGGIPFMLQRHTE